MATKYAPHATSCYSAKVYFNWDKFPPLSAPDSVWKEWHRLRREAGLETEVEQC